MRTLTITDTNHPRDITADKHEAVDAIRPWFPEASSDVADQLDQLDGILSHGRGWEHLEEIEAALGIHVEIS